MKIGKLNLKTLPFPKGMVRQNANSASLSDQIRAALSEYDRVFEESMVSCFSAGARLADDDIYSQNTVNHFTDRKNRVTGLLEVSLASELSNLEKDLQERQTDFDRWRKDYGFDLSIPILRL